MATRKGPTLGSVTDAMFMLREKRRKIAAEDKLLKEEFDALELTLIGLLDANDTQACKGSKASASVSEETQFNLDGANGWDLFMAFCAKHKYFHLVQRRLSAPALRELFATKGQVPGVMPYTKRSVNLTTLQ